MSDLISHGRRRILRSGLFAAAALVTARVATHARTAAAQDTSPKLEETDPQAQALGYRHDSAQVDSSKYPTHKPDQTCAGCQLYTAADAAWGHCALFQGKLVSGAGWCSAWVKKS